MPKNRRKTPSSWSVQATEAAGADFAAIIDWTTRQFGADQARVYRVTLTSAIRALRAGPTTLGARTRPDIGVGLYSLHVARAGRRGRHIVLFRAVEAAGNRVIQVLRLLHDSMDLPRHGPD